MTLTPTPSQVTTDLPAMQSTDRGKRPLVSVIVEGYNENHSVESGVVLETLNSIQKQAIPLDQVELVITGGLNQVREWEAYCSRHALGFTVKPVVFEGHYWEAKNQGAQAATGEILAFIDCDVRPHTTWLSSIVQSIQAGADAAIGPSLFHQNQRESSPWLWAAGSISWGFVIGKASNQASLTAASCLGHNLAVRAEVFKHIPFRTEHQRSFIANLFYEDLARAGKRVVFQPTQRTRHDFTWKWWLLKHRFRAGWETYLFRQIDEAHDYNRSLARLSLIAPLVTKLWHVCLDVPQWFRYSRAIDLPWWQRAGLLPVLLLMSLLARGTEMLGMYAALIAPRQTERWTRF